MSRMHGLALSIGTGFVLAALASQLSGCGEVTAEEHTTAGIVQSIATSGTVNVPIFFHFLFDRIDPATGLPAYAVDQSNETILAIDNVLAASNVVLANAAGADGRRVRFVRVGVAYSLAPGACPDPITSIDRVWGAINVTLTSICSGVTTAAFATRATAGSLLHELGHTLGLEHIFLGNTDWDTVEFMYRDRDPNHPESCFRRGDFTCDTPPDYGAFGHNVCSTLIPDHDLCVQDGPYPFTSGGPLAPCNPADAVVDATGVCTTLAGGDGRRTYDPALLGLFVDRPGNVMGYHIPSFFTQEQLLRMHNYVQWRLRVPDRVPATEQAVRFGFLFGPPDPIWDRPTDRDSALTNVVTAAFTRNGTVPVPATLTAVNPIGPGRRVMGLRISANVSGAPSANLRVIITPPRGASAVTVPATSIRVAGGKIVADEAFASTSAASPLASLRGMRSLGTWSVRVEDTAPITISALTLELLQGDRGYLTNDRHARGVSDVAVFRPSTSQVWISANLMNGSAQFGGGLFHQAAAAPGSKIIAGDIDGDGAIDLLARNGSSVSVAFNEESYAIWRPGFIEGTDLPLANDEVLLGDFDGDGFGDLMRRRADLSINRGRWRYHRGIGDGRFHTGVAPAVGGSDGDVAYVAGVRWTTGDLDGDGRSDIMLRVNGSGLFWIASNLTPRTAPGGVTPAPSFWGGWNPLVGGSHFAYADSDRLAAMDVNQDGLDDIVVRRNGTGEWITSTNNGNGTYGAGVAMSIGGSPTAYSDSDVVLGALP